MKKIFYSFMVLLAATITFTSCEDVPMPYDAPGTGGGNNSEATTIEPTGSGTAEDPYNIAAIQEFVKNLNMESGATADGNVYFKGKIVSIKEITDASSYGNASIYLSDDGTSKNQFYVYRCYGPGNKKFTSTDIIKEGDEVVVYCSKFVNYNGTLETNQNSSYIVSVNGEGNPVGPTEPITGDNLLANGDFESWDGSQPTNWKSASTASNATLSQSTDAHGGSYAVKVGFSADQNKRLAYKELNLKAGTYEFSFYVKSTTSTASQCQAGYVPVTNGSVGSYVYGGYETINNTSWKQVKNVFTLDAATTICLVVMNPKTSSYATAQEILVDDAVLKTNDGGIAEGTTPDNPDQPNVGDAKHITIAEFLAKADPNTNYELTGVVKNISSTTYGNFDLVEGDAKIYIYGLLDLNGASKNFASLGINEGDEITVVGKYFDYNGKAEIKDAQFIKINKKGNGENTNPDNPDTPNPPSGSNILENGGFESWNGSEPTNWKSSCTASNATLSQSTDAHGGTYSVKVGGNASANKRLAYKEITLPAGTYTFSFYAKSTTADKSQCRPGYTTVENGTANSNYTYGDYASLNNNSWTLVTNEFTLTAETTLCLVVMNPKTSSYATAQDILIDDASLIKK